MFNMIKVNFYEKGETPLTNLKEWNSFLKIKKEDTLS